ncbi:MAG: PLP-dependent aminotransferase family protein [Firmicutes bacterium]|nr:PLP-dependent aminotransferase family protein [Bacillota bacterium]
MAPGDLGRRLEGLFSGRARAVQRSELAALFALAERPDVISFAGGFPDPAWFLPECEEVAARLLREARGSALQYGPTPGLTAFREYVAERCRRQGMEVAPAEVVVTSGALQGLDLVAKVFLEPGDPVVVECPTYLGAIQTLSTYEARLVEVPGDEVGLVPEALDETLRDLERSGRPAKFVYVVPSFQNPTGLTLPLDRRRSLLEVASRHGLPVVEDHAYAELRYDGEPVPSLKALDREGLVILLGTFSKIFSPGLRLGWTVAPAAVTEKIILFKQGTDQCSSTLGQMMALEYGRLGLIERQIAVTTAGLREKKRLTLEVLDRRFGPLVRRTEPEGGFYTWLTLPEGVDTARMLERAVRDHRVAYVAGPAFYVGRRGSSQLRLCYSLLPGGLIDEGVRRLRECYEAESAGAR